jgi:hypothetical protein
MSVIYWQRVEECLLELSSLDEQHRLWKSSGPPEVSSFVEAVEQLFLDSGLDHPLHAGKTGRGQECEQRLIELEEALMSVNANQTPDALIVSSEMEKVRRIATVALSALQARREGNQS